MKKSLLNESEIRKFMKFANITPLTENFLDRVQEETVAEEETVTEETVAEVTDPYWAPTPGDAPVTEETLAEGDIDEEALVRALVAAIMDHTDADITVQGSEEDADVDADVDADLDTGDEEGEMDLDAIDVPEEDDEDEIPSDLVEAITRRVAARLLNENRK